MPRFFYMALYRMRELWRIENALSLMVAITIVGVANSFTAPFLSLFGVQEVGMSPTAYGIFISLTTLTGVVSSLILGRLSDGYLSRKWIMLISIACAIIGFGLFTVVRNFYLLLVISAVFVGTESTVLPQVLAYTRESVDHSGFKQVPFAMSTFRMFFSLAWAVGPAIGSVLLIQTGFTGLFSFAAVGFAISGVLVLIFFKHHLGDFSQKNIGNSVSSSDSVAPIEVEEAVSHKGQKGQKDQMDRKDRTDRKDKTDRKYQTDQTTEIDVAGSTHRPETPKNQPRKGEQSVSEKKEHINLRKFLTQPKMIAIFTSFTFLSTAQSMIAIAMPLYVTMTLQGSDVQVGMLFSVAAALEIPLMLLTGALASKSDSTKMILLGCLVCMTYLLTVGLTTAPWQIIPLQILTAITVSIVMGVGITYFQDFIPGEPGTATTLYTNTLKIGTMLGGILAGLIGDYFGFRAVFMLGAILPAVSFLLILGFGTEFLSKWKAKRHRT